MVCGRIEGADPVLVWQRRESCPDRVPLGLVLGVAEVPPSVLLLQLLEPGEQASTLAARDLRQRPRARSR